MSRAPFRIAELAALLLRHAPVDGVHATAIPGAYAIRSSAPSEEFAFALHQPAVCVIAQGAKRVMLGGEVLRYDASTFIVYSLDLPIAAEVVQASADHPYLCLRLDIDAAQVAELLLRSTATPPPVPDRDERGLFLCRIDDEMLDAVVRLLRLLDKPADLTELAPLAIREILYRLLRSEEGGRFAGIAHAEGHVRRVSRAVAWLKTHFAEPLRVEELARHADMSVSALHQRFKSVTALSPLQYQKQLRLLEARRLLLASQGDIASAAFRVGYESPSQFSREYSRTFGLPPSRDLQRLRAGEAAVIA